MALNPSERLLASSERTRRWRMVLGRAVDPDGTDIELPARDREMDAALAALYERQLFDQGRGGGLGSSAPTVTRWLGDIRQYFPSSIVKVIQADAMERLNLHTLLMDPQVLSSVEADVDLVATLLTLKSVIPDETTATARAVVSRVVEDIERRIATRTRSAARGALNRSARTRRPRHGDIDWGSTIRANLRHYQPELQTVIPETLIGYGRTQRAVEREVILAVDQSGSMASSVVYSSVFAAVLASIRALRTHLIAFDTSVVDLSDHLDDPVDILFGFQLGGGTDIAGAVAYCQGVVANPTNTLFVLVSDLLEGGVSGQLIARLARMRADGVQCVVLLALSDDGAPVYDTEHAAMIRHLGIPVFACTPDVFPDMLEYALAGQDLPASIMNPQPT